MNSPREYPQQLQGTCLVYGDVCSGISAPSVAWKPLGWRPAFFAEVAKFPSAVLRHHYPDTPNHGDFTTIQAGDYEPIDVLVGGTPCQDFSVAGLRAGMDGARGQLTVEFARLAGRLRPRWLVWENVPGVLSIDGGRAFGTFLGLLGELGYGFAYRVLDAQHFNCAFPRPRVFVLGYRGDWRPPAAALFERACLEGHQKRYRAEEETSGSAAVLTSRGGMAHDDRSNYILDDFGIRTSTPLEWERALGFPDEYTALSQTEGVSGRPAASQLVDPIRHDSGTAHAAISETERSMRNLRNDNDATGCGSLPCDGLGARDALSRLQHKTASSRRHGLGNACVGVSGRRSRRVADGPRYKALGNSMAVPVLRWIGERIAAVDVIAVLQEVA